MKVKPTQVTLVPDAPDAITSNSGWNVKDNFDYLSELVDTFTSQGIRTSIFVGTDLANIELAAKTGTDRIELYTEPYATYYPEDRDKAIRRKCRTRFELRKSGFLQQEYPLAGGGFYRPCLDL